MISWTIGQEPTRGDIDAYPGAPIDFTVPVLDGDGAVQSVTGWTVAAQARAGDTLLHTFTLTAGADGVEVAATGAETATWAAWPAPTVRWDLWATPPAGDASPIVTGWVRIHPTITHS